MNHGSAPDAFDALGISPSFVLDPEELGSRQRELSRALHPDRFIGRPAGERRQALGRAIEVNEAHRVLKDPLTRAEALLKRLGLSADEHAEPAADPMFLMEIMESREALRDAGRAKDVARIEAMARSFREREREVLALLGGEFAQALESSNATDETLIKSLQANLGQLRYLRRFLTEADALVDDLA